VEPADCLSVYPIPKRRYPSYKLHGVTSPNNLVFCECTHWNNSGTFTLLLTPASKTLLSAKKFLASEEMTHILCNHNVHYSTNNRWFLADILSSAKLTQPTYFHLISSKSIVILPSHIRIRPCLSSTPFDTHFQPNPASASYPLRATYPHQCDSSWFDHSNNI